MIAIILITYHDKTLTFSHSNFITYYSLLKDFVIPTYTIIINTRTGCGRLLATIVTTEHKVTIPTKRTSSFFFLINENGGGVGVRDVEKCDAHYIYNIHRYCYNDVT